MLLTHQKPKTTVANAQAVERKRANASENVELFDPVEASEHTAYKQLLKRCGMKEERQSSIGHACKEKLEIPMSQ